MKVLIINTSERNGGAAVAAGRLFSALQKAGIDVNEVVCNKASSHKDVIAVGNGLSRRICFLWERFWIWVYNRFNRKNLFKISTASSGLNITSLSAFKEADIIHLHWINQGLLSLKGIKRIVDSGKPIVWTMHDMWAFTGICHYALTCDAYHSECHNCFYLQKGGTLDLSTRIHQKKMKAYGNGGVVSFVACSRWLADCARKSSLLQHSFVTDIPNPIDTSLFLPKDQNTARLALNLPEDMHLILFGSMKITDERKGLSYFVDACKKIAVENPQSKENIGIIIFGSCSETAKQMFPFNVFSLGYINDNNKLVDIYNAVDMFVTPSLDENLPNMVMEAMACGTLCVGFNTGGIPQMIDHLKNGYVAEYKSADDLARGITTLMYSDEKENMKRDARNKVLNEYSESIVSNKYISLYKRLLKK